MVSSDYLHFPRFGKVVIIHGSTDNNGRRREMTCAGKTLIKHFSSPTGVHPIGEHCRVLSNEQNILGAEPLP